jgi:hypothetical protein
LLNGANLGSLVFGAALDIEGNQVKKMADAGKWVANGKIYNKNFQGNQYINKAASIAKFNKYIKTIKVAGKAVGVFGGLVSFAQWQNGDISGPRFAANLAITGVGVFNPALGIGLGVLEATYGDQIEDMMWDERPKN